MAAPDMWSEVALVSIQKLSGNSVEFYTITDSVDFKIGQKDVDFVATLSGGRLANFKPMEPTEVTMKVYPNELGTSSGLTGKGVFDLFCANTTDATQPLDFSVDRGRTKYRVTFLVTDDTTVTSATSLITINQCGARLIAKNGFLVEATPTEYTPESGWIWTVRFKFAPFGKDGTANISGQSTDGTATMTMSTVYSS
jgi:hypothetical protein